jgi:3-oxoacyl-(acyl-carrier-protein) synthase
MGDTARGARIYAELAGDGNSLSSYRITDSPPDGDGPIQSMHAALADAAATPADVDYLNAHGTSTPMNDKSESAALHVVFGDDVRRVNVSSTKSSMGHLIAAAGAVEVAVCALAIDHDECRSAPTSSSATECNLSIVTGTARRQRVRMAMSNSFGFGGSNSCIVLRNPEEVDGFGASAAPR